MDIKQIKEVIDLMKKAELSNFEIEDKGFKLRLQRANGCSGAVQVVQAAAPAAVAVASSPAAAPSVGIGSNVKADSVVCIVEAMKVMNEVQAEIAGTIVEVLLSSGTSVEYGQPLFKIKVA